MSEKLEFLKGVTLISIEGASEGSDRVTMRSECGKTYAMYHIEDCCESVEIQDIAGDIEDLLNTPILEAYEESNSDNRPDNADDSWTWTFYRLTTIHGTVVFRWLGESNGYYSESVEFERLS